MPCRFCKNCTACKFYFADLQNLQFCALAISGSAYWTSRHKVEGGDQCHHIMTLLKPLLFMNDNRELVGRISNFLSGDYMAASDDEFGEGDDDNGDCDYKV